MTFTRAAAQKSRQQPTDERAAPLTREGRAPGGRLLPVATRLHMERQLGHSFETVRIHAGGEAESVGAHAFALGEDIHFAAGAYSPDSPNGQRRIAHELTHVIQQSGGIRPTI